ATRERRVLHLGRRVAGLDVLDTGAQPFHAVADVEVPELAGQRAGHRDVEQRLGGGIPVLDAVARVDDDGAARQRVERALGPLGRRRLVPGGGVLTGGAVA